MMSISMVALLLLLCEKLVPTVASSPPPAELALQFDELDYSASLDSKFVSNDDDEDDSIISNFEPYLDSLELVCSQSSKPSFTASASTQTDDAIGTDPNGTLAIGTDSNETLTSVALSFTSCNLPAVLISASIAHQAAKTVQRCIMRFLGPTGTAWKRAGAVLQQREDAHFRKYLSRIRATELMYMNCRDTYFSSQTTLLFNELEPAKLDAYYSVSPEVSNDDLIKFIEEDRAYLPLHRHALLSKEAHSYNCMACRVL